MQVLFIARRASPDIGGVEKHIGQVIRQLKIQKLKVKIKVVTERDINPPKIKFIGLFYIWWWMFKNRKLIYNSKLVHCHDVFIWYFPFRFLLFKKPVFTTFHGWEGVFPIPYKNKLIKRLSAKLSWGNICVGEFIEKWYGIKSDYITYGGVEITKSKIKTHNSKSSILYIGRLEKDTGIKLVLKSLKLVKEKYPKMEISFLGDGPYREDAEKIGKVLGFQKDVTSYISDASYVIASGYLTVLEAMISKKIVFTFADNDLKRDYFAAFNPYMIKPFPKETTLLKNIEYFNLNPKLEEKMIDKAYQFAREQTWKSVAEKYLNLWKKYL